ncbi:MAG: DJ-1 family glyoxalase III [Halanaerobium sp.]
MQKILIPLAKGFEEIEAITNIDVLRRAGFNVITAGIDGKNIKGDHGVKIEADIDIKDIKKEEISDVVLPGGMPGAANLRDSSELLQIIRDVYQRGGLCAAICAAPMVLEAADILENKNATSYPGFDDQMDSANYKTDRVVKDGNIITGRGPGVALEFALAVVEYLADKDSADELKKAMLFKEC